jgi:hypothetical protein
MLVVQHWKDELRARIHQRARRICQGIDGRYRHDDRPEVTRTQGVGDRSNHGKQRRKVAARECFEVEDCSALPSDAHGRSDRARRTRQRSRIRGQSANACRTEGRVKV